MADPIGRVNVEIGADTSKLKQGVSDAERDTRKLGDSGEKAGRQMGEGFETAGKKLSRLQEGFSKLLIPIALFTGFARLIDFIGKSRHELDLFDRKLGDIAASSTKRLNEAQRTAAQVPDSERAILQAQEAARSEIDQITRDLEDRMMQVSQRFKDNSLIYEYVIGGATSEDLKRVAEQRIEQINESTRQLVARLRRQARQDAEAAERQQAEAEAEQRVKVARDAAGRIFSEIEKMRIDLLPEEDQIKAKTELALNTLRDQLQAQGILNEEDIQIALDNYAKFLNRKRDLDEKERTERINKEERAEIEKAQRVARASADALQRELERVSNQIGGIFGDGFQGFDQLANAINGVRTEIQRRGGL